MCDSGAEVGVCRTFVTARAFRARVGILNNPAEFQKYVGGKKSVFARAWYLAKGMGLRIEGNYAYNVTAKPRVCGGTDNGCVVVCLAARPIGR